MNATVFLFRIFTMVGVSAALVIVAAEIGRQGGAPLGGRGSPPQESWGGDAPRRGPWG